MTHDCPQIVNRHGPEADRHLLRCLFSHVDFSGDGKSSGKDFHQVKSGTVLSKVTFLQRLNFWLTLFCLLQTQFLIQECVSLITKPNFISTLCYAIDNPLHYQKVCTSVKVFTVVLYIWIPKGCPFATSVLYVFQRQVVARCLLGYDRLGLLFTYLLVVFRAWSHHLIYLLSWVKFSS